MGLIKPNYYRLLKYIFIILFPVAIYLGNFQALIFNEKFYFHLYETSNTYQNFVRENTVNNETKNLIGFYRGKNTLDYNFYSKQADFHLKDVKYLINFSTQIFLLNIFSCSFIAFYFLKHKKPVVLFQSIFLASTITMVSVLLLSLGLSRAFESLFISFHKIIFTNNLWAFDESDNLVKLFPEQFFINFTNQLALNIFLSSLLTTICSFVIKSKLRNDPSIN